jgi:hypothetical protein
VTVVNGSRVHSRLTRRGLLAAGSLGVVGLALPQVLAADERTSKPASRLPGFGRARSCLLIWLKGGPSQLDTFDPKPDAPAEIRGEFASIGTRAAGIRFSEQVPHLADVADRLLVVRSLTHGDNNHASAAYEMSTGHAYPRAQNLANISTRDDHPHLGGTVSAVLGKSCPVPPFVMVPDKLVVNGEFRSGQNGGFLGTRHDPLVPGGDPSRDDFQPVDLGLGEAVETGRLRDRRALLDEVNQRMACRADATAGEMDAYRQKAFSLLETGRTRAAFDLGSERPQVREAYGRNFFGQSVLLGRRLLEAGVRLVHVNCMSSIFGGDKNWDTHKDNFNLLRQTLLPRTDLAIARLLADLDATGQLDETLVVVTGEFGRTPKINANAGRDHWPQVFSVLLAGAGLPRGAVYGSSDKQSAEVAASPVTSSQLAATIFHALGIDPALQLAMQTGRPWKIAEAGPVTDLWS